MKSDWLDIIILRDGGRRCWYCKVSLSLSEIVWEHLNCNRKDNRIDNMVLACFTCNNKKPHDFDMQFLATEKIHENEKCMYMREKSHGQNKQSSEIEINMSNYEIAELFLLKNNPIEYSEALDSISYECRKKTGHGSQQSVRNYINTLTSKSAPFEIIKENGKKIICRKLESSLVSCLKTDV
jgi:hypothetical protein